MFKHLLFIVAISLMFTNHPSNTANAADANTWHVGAQLGGVFPSDSFETRFGFGGRFGYQIFDEWSLGFSFLYSTAEILTIDASFSEFLLDSYYHYENWRFGAKLGLVRLGLELTILGISFTGSTTDFAVGPAVGYDFMIPGMDGLSIGPELSSIFYLAENNTVTLIDALVVAKYYF